MTTAAWFCGGCGEIIRNPYERIEKRIEYRTIKGQARYAVILVGHLCKACADTEVDALRGAGDPADQGSLL